MAKTSVIMRQAKREKTVARFVQTRLQLKEAIRNPQTSEEDKWIAQQKLQALPRNASPVRLRNRCKLTGRPRGVYRKFGISRSMLRLCIMRGEAPGFVKSSW